MQLVRRHWYDELIPQMIQSMNFPMIIVATEKLGHEADATELPGLETISEYRKRAHLPLTGVEFNNAFNFSFHLGNGSYLNTSFPGVTKEISW